MRKTKKTLAILAIVAMVLAMLPVQVFAATTSAVDKDRYAGADRIATALDVASNWTSAYTIILAPADDDNLVDALAAAPLAGQENAPILLTYKSGLNADVKAKIAALGAKKVYVVGAAANDAVVNALTGVTVEKLAGADRWATADAINAKLTNVAGTFVVGYDAIPDALSAASYAAANKYAIVLTNVDGTVNAAKLVGSKTYLVGGTGVVKDYAGATRFGGADRYATNEAVVKGLTYEFSKVYIANGETLVDALVAAPLAAQAKAAVLLANTSVAGADYVNGKLASDSKVIALGGTGVVSDAVKGGVGYQAPAVLAVESVSAINLKQIQVKFNKAMDKTTVENEANYTVDGTTLSTVNDTATLQSDNQTVVITLNTALPNNTEKAVIVGTGVKDAAGSALASSYTTKVKYADSTVPTVSSASVTGKSAVRVIFSEPVYDGVDLTLTATDFVIDGGSYIVSAATSVPSKNAVDLTLGSNITAGTHTLKVKAGTIEDYALYKIIEQTITFDYAGDTVAPTVSVKKATETTVTLQFSEGVVNVNDANVRYRHTYDNDSYKVLGNDAGAVAVVADTDDKEWTVTFGSTKPLAPGTVKLYIGYVSSTGTKIQDKFGNDFVATSIDVNVTEDKTAPTITKVAFVDSTHLDVTYSEKVTGADVVSNYSLKDADGNAVSVSGAVLQTGDTYRLTTATMNGGSYNLTVGGVKDTSLAQNSLVTVTIAVAANDKIAPTVSSVVTNKDAGTNADKLRIRFSEAMADDNLTSASSYWLKVDGGAATALPTGTTITKVNSKTVDIAFPSAVTNLNADGTDVLSVSGLLKDVAGNEIGGLVSDVTIGVDTVAVVADSAKALDKRTIEFRVNKQVSSVNASFISEDANAGIAVATVTAANDTAKDQGIITVKLDADIATSVTGTTFNIAVADGGITTDFGYDSSAIANAVTQATAKDYIKPDLSSVATGDNDADGQIDRLVVTYSENIQQTSVSASDYTVEGRTITDVTVSGTQVTLKIAESGVVDNATTPSVTQVGEVADDSAQHNVLGSQAAKTSTDGAAPLAAVIGKLTIAATQVSGTAGAVEAGATVKIVADNAGSAAAAAGSGTVVAAADGSFAAITGLTAATAYDVYVLDAAGNASAKLDITTP